ncbi:IclR family transcriptional regulator [Kineococcus rhizosphaerae]|uniref:IclR family transcriptional regulator n=1 Tax=Kineococcus rhizosphaerae TaxID=559628 RepID=A0A2T0R224_9ACTN|nr:IclR family transcriptional regulator [Kineococcus rhizosphaerae]PRY13580.1 IclR family transcriptional regulator [Kineococcus rhizosphaerae]
MANPEETSDTDAGRGPVKSAERTVHILQALAQPPYVLTVAQLQERTGYPRSSLHALLRTLVDLQWIEPPAASGPGAGGYGIGSRALLTGTAYLDRDAALPRALATVEAVRDETGCTTHVARLDGPNVVYLATRDAPEAHRSHSRVGRFLPAYATSLGKALLAERTAAELDALLPPGPFPALTPDTVADRAALEVELEAVRTRGWALERGQNLPGTVCVGVRVEYRIPATDALSCSLPADIATDEEVERVAQVLTRHAGRLARDLRAAGIR